MKRLDFLREGLRNLRTVGTITRSSRFVSSRMASFVDFSKALHIAELGAGDGVITRHILKRMRPDATLYAFEVLPSMADELRQIKDERLVILQDSAEFIGEHLDRLKVGQVDAMISAIPFVALPTELGIRILKNCHQRIKPGGKFIQIHYSLLAKRLYEKIFGNVRIYFEPRNLPPAFILVSEVKP